MLPPAFAPIESLLQRMTIRQTDLSPGLLALGQLGSAVDEELASDEMLKLVRQAIASDDQVCSFRPHFGTLRRVVADFLPAHTKRQQLLSALFRDYSFLTSAYLLEPVDRSFRATGKYGSGRSILPRSLAVPMQDLANALNQFPFMEYSSSYALQNYKRVVGNSNIHGELGKADSWNINNLRVIRAFEDKNGSEAGFILIHVAMVAQTGKSTFQFFKLSSSVVSKVIDRFNQVKLCPMWKTSCLRSATEIEGHSTRVWKS